MIRIRWLKDIHAKDIGVAGGKGANLGEMYNLGFSVPNAFIVTAQAYDEFIKRTKIKNKIFAILKGLDTEDTERLQKTAKKIQNLIKKTPIPKEIAKEVFENYKKLGGYVAVRSSATAEDLPEASFAGQQATYLNMHEKNIVNSVRDCWASLFTARAIYYRERNNFPHEKVLIAVVIQHMVDSDAAGVMFSINPATNNENEIIIEGGFGLGEAVVSGSVNPDFYVVDKKTMKITTLEVKEKGFAFYRDEKTRKTVKKELTDERDKQVLTKKQIIELAKIGKKIENHYKLPQDIEWALEKGKLYITQSRAVTTFKKTVQKEEVIKAKVLLKGETASPGSASGSVKVVKSLKELGKVKQGDVMVAVMTTPDMVPAMKKAAAIITDEGGMTCHAAIVSREMQIPCIVGTRKATKTLKDKQTVTVAATHAVVYKGAVHIKEEVEMPKEKIKTKTKVKVIVDIPDIAEKAAETGADGVGLVRLEIIIAEGGIHPAYYIKMKREKDYIKLLVKGIERIAKAFKGKPVWVRTSDIRTDEYRSLKGGKDEPHETDPMIGWHGIRRSLDQPDILKAEFKAIKELHKKGYKNVGVMIPFVIRAREVRRAKEIMQEIGLKPRKNVVFGIMVETPAACWAIEEICKEGIDFVSFGTNDLTQLTLGIDRNNEKIAKLFNEMHHAVLKELSHVMGVCKRYKVETSICGQAGSRPEMAEFLVKHKVGSISANPDAVYQIRKVVSLTEKKLGVK